MELRGKGAARGSAAKAGEAAEKEGCSRSTAGEDDDAGWCAAGRLDEERAGTKLSEMLRTLGAGMMRCEERRCMAACWTSSAGVMVEFEAGCDAVGAEGRTPTDEERLKPGLAVPLSSARLCRLEEERLKPRASQLD